MIFRFAVGAHGGSRSTAWKLWSHREDIYMLQRSHGGVHKLSFHRSGNCRWALIKEPRTGIDRAVVKWTRVPVPRAGTGQGSILVKLAFPTNHLSDWRDGDDKALHWIKPAARGRATGIEVFLTREPRSEIEKQFGITEDRRLAAFGAMPNGVNLCVAALAFDCGRVELNAPAEPAMPGQVFGDLRFPDVDDRATGRPIRMLMMPPIDGPCPTIWELGGYQVEK